MFALGTIHLGTNLRRILNAFVSTANDPFPDPEVYFADIAGLLYRLKNIIILVQIIMLDLLLTYRCYIVWDRRVLITLLPLTGVFVYLILAVAGVGAIHAFAVYKHDTIFTGTPRKWVSAALSTTFVTKLICLATILIGSLVPRKNSSWQAFISRSSYNGCIYKTFLMTIETGGLAFLGTLILLPTYLSRSNAQETILNTLSSLTGEAFVLIFISGLLGFIPSNTGPASRTRRQRYYNNNQQKSIIPTIHPEKSTRTSSNSVFHFNKGDKKVSSDTTTSAESIHPSDETSIGVISVRIPPKSVQIPPPPELVFTTTKMPVSDPLAYKPTELEVPKLSQQRHPFAMATPVTFP